MVQNVQLKQQNQKCNNNYFLKQVWLDRTQISWGKRPIKPNVGKNKKEIETTKNLDKNKN